ncbi:hypothetical protein LEN26_001935 [Aphanomyces euteiches]|nr:hypothetical protein AeMF1_013934 [Aphanomyces euteiches]KAH9160282.1 hypothetical protein LEN26_001935 [Aphanomyces euteiches]KAH9194074.1 hypothetical protein AeNC1_003950 [Aphanomyces euteiches]
MEMDLGQVKTHVQSCFPLLDALYEELAVLRKIIYKNTSQHRRAQYFQYLVHVKRLHRRLKKEEAVALLKSILQVLDTLTVRDGMHHVSWKVLGECKATLDSILRQLQAVSIILTDAMVAEKKAFRALGTQYAMTFFMPFCVVTTSLLGRLFTLNQTLLVRCVEAHHALTLAYLAQATLSNPLYASTVAAQLAGYELSSSVLAHLELESVHSLQESSSI